MNTLHTHTHTQARAHTHRNYSPQVVARVIWVTAPSAMSSLLRGSSRDGEKEIGRERKRKRRNEKNKRTDGIKKQWRWWRALAQAALPEDMTVLSFFTNTLVLWPLRPCFTEAVKVIFTLTI